jgi:sporulation protein YlmC with PRC-barrel domain
VPTIHVQDLIGRQVIAMNGRPVGRIEELRVDPGRGVFEVMAVVLGTGGLLERLSIARSFGRRSKTIVARWDQIDLADPLRPKLTCKVEELEIS